MRQISISTDVFARIWSLRASGEDTEDAILKRILLRAAVSPLSPRSPESLGIFDSRHNVMFREGFEVFRAYLGRNYRARVLGSRWILEDGRTCGSLNELSRSIGAKTENAWQNWFFKDESGLKRPVSDLRDPTTVSARKHEAEMNTQSSEAPDFEITNRVVHTGEGTWRDDVTTALSRLGGKAPLHSLYREVEAIRKQAGRSLPSQLEATVRRTLEDHSSDSDNFRGADLFYMPEGKGAGIWALRP